MNWTRRSLLTSLLSYPTICATSPLIDIENGSSMFSRGPAAAFNIKRSVVKPKLPNNNQVSKLNDSTTPLDKHSQLIKFNNIHTGEAQEIEYNDFKNCQELNSLQAKMGLDFVFIYSVTTDAGVRSGIISYILSLLSITFNGNVTP